MDVVMKRGTRGQRPQEKEFREDRRVVRVVPANETLRRFLKHGITKVKFPAQGSVEWPNDQFTRNRIRDGDVTIEAPAQIEQRKQLSAQQKGARQQGQAQRVARAKPPTEKPAT